MPLYENVKLELYLYFYISIYIYIYIFFFHKVQGFENITENTYLILKALEHWKKRKVNLGHNQSFVFNFEIEQHRFWRNQLPSEKRFGCRNIMCVKLCQNFRGTIRKHIYLYVTKTFSVATLTLFCSFRMEQKKQLLNLIEKLNACHSLIWL